MAYVETFERAAALDGPREVVRQVRCAARWRLHVHVLQPGQDEPPAYQPRKKSFPVAPPVERPRMTDEERERMATAMAVLRGMREDLEQRRESPPRETGLPVVGRDDFQRQRKEEAAVTAPIPKYPPEKRARAVELVLGGMSQRETARVVGVPDSAVCFWVAQEKKRKSAPVVDDNHAAAPDVVQKAADALENLEVLADYSAPPDRTDDQVAQALLAAAAERTSAADQWQPEPEVKPAGVAPRELPQLRPHTSFDTGVEFISSMSLAHLAGLDDVGDQVCAMWLAFRGKRKELKMLGDALAGAGVTA